MRYIFLFIISLSITVTAGERKPTEQGLAMDYGPVMHYFTELQKPVKQIIHKAVFVRLDHEAAIAFDTETMRYAAAWHGGYINMGTTNITRLVQGTGGPDIIGTLDVATLGGPGFIGPQQKWDDPRTDGIGNLPSTWGTYRGLYRHGKQVIFSYTINQADFLDMPQAHVASDVTWYVRNMAISANKKPITLLVADVDKADGKIEKDGAYLNNGLQKDVHTVAKLLDGPQDCVWSVKDGRMTITIPAQNKPYRVRYAVAAVNANGLPQAVQGLSSLASAPDIEALCRGGEAQWPAESTVGELGKSDWAYTLDTITMPNDNQWKSWMRPIGMDFFSDGRLAISTMGGDVWIASGIDDGLKKITWKRFASGLFEPLGLKIVKDQIYVLCRDQLARLDDLNNDQEADFYVSINRDAPVYPKYNDFAFDLVTDRAGNFYYGRGGHGATPDYPMHNAIIKVSPDGKSSSVFATGLRTPSGLGIGPNDELTTADNQGNWTPVNRINLVKQNGWYGYVGNPSMYKNTIPDHPKTYDAPLCWIPMVADNSPGSQIWSGDKWGPLSNMMFHLSYGQSTMLAVLHETVNGQVQGGVVTLPLRFASGIFRGAINPKDGQCYVAGIKGWQTNAGADGCLQRVRATGKPAVFPKELHVQKNAIRLTFTDPLDPDTVSADSVSVQRWNYLWTKSYGSPDVSIADPNKKSRDTLTVNKVTLSQDGKTIDIFIDDIKPVDQMGITVKFADTAGNIVKYTVYHTINVVP